MIGIPDVILNNIGGAVGTDSNFVINLGVGLGFELPVAFRYAELNHQSGNVSPTGTKKMLSDWRLKTSSNEQKVKLRGALQYADLLLIAETHLSESVGTDRDTNTVDTEIADEGFDDTEIADERYDQSHELLCRKCDTFIANTSNVIDTKKSSLALKTRSAEIMGKDCQVQLIEAVGLKTGKVLNRYDVITLATADVKLSDEVIPRQGGFKDYQGHRFAWCKKCSKQVGWYFVPEDNTSSEPFYWLWLQTLIHDFYDSD